MPNFWLIFTTGLITGGLSCLAVQGGLLATTVAERQAVGNAKKSGTVAVLLFLLAKLAAYTVLGALLGWAGSFFQLSLATRALLQGAVAVFMVGTALGLLDVHPFFRYFILQPPRFLTKMVRTRAKNADFFAPAVLGLMTVFVPCGVTQAMMALAIGSGNPFFGALIMFSFVLGTSPLFFIFGFVATALKNVFQEKFQKIAAYAVIVIALWSLNGAAALAGSDWTIENLWEKLYCTVSYCDDSAVLTAYARAVTETTVNINSDGYQVDNPVILAGAEITLHINNKEGRGCIESLTIPKVGISKSVPIGETATVKFKAPSEPGELPFMCSMGMYRGKFIVAN